MFNHHPSARRSKRWTGQAATSTSSSQIGSKSGKMMFDDPMIFEQSRESKRGKTWISVLRN